jgi:hypothetical protein
MARLRALHLPQATPRREGSKRRPRANGNDLRANARDADCCEGLLAPWSGIEPKIVSVGNDALHVRSTSKARGSLGNDRPHFPMTTKPSRRPAARTPRDRSERGSDAGAGTRIADGDGVATGRREDEMSAFARSLMGLGSVLVAACSTTVPTETPGVERLGRTLLRYAGPEVEADVSYRIPTLDLGEDWLFLDVAFTAVDEPVEIDRTKVWVRTPAGEEIPLATQEEFRAAHGELTPKMASADVAGEPLGQFPGRTEKRLEFFATPFEDLVVDSFWVTYRDVYVGRLYFNIPGGVQAGHWELHVKLAESELRIPFRLQDE